MISCVKEYERLAVAAILQQDKSLAVRALMAHPLIGSGRWRKPRSKLISTISSSPPGGKSLTGPEA